MTPDYSTADFSFETGASEDGDEPEFFMGYGCGDEIEEDDG